MSSHPYSRDPTDPTGKAGVRSKRMKGLGTWCALIPCRLACWLRSLYRAGVSERERPRWHLRLERALGEKRDSESPSLVRVQSTVCAFLQASVAAVPTSVLLPISVPRSPHARSLGLFLKAERILESFAYSVMPPFPHSFIQHVAAISSVNSLDRYPVFDPSITV